MGELRILEGLIVFLIVLPLFRPFFPRLAGLDGLLFLPFVSFLITLAIFPAYGFRPECIPLLLYTFFLSIVYLPPVLVRLKLFRLARVQKDGPAFTALFLFLLVPAAVIALLFAPSGETGPVTGGVSTQKIENASGGNEYTLRIYGSGEKAVPGKAPGPLVLVVPPLAGSVGFIDQVCRELRDRGFTVITYARKNLDVPPPGKESKPPGLSPAALYRAFRMYTRGLKSLAVNAQARALEAERMGDVIFLLSYIRQEHPGDPVFSGIPTGAVFIAGYGIGGGALVRLAGSPGFTQTNPGVKGIIAIESPVFSAFTGEDPPPPQAAGGDESRLRSLWTGIIRWFSRWKRQKITGLGVIPRPEVPALYMVSDRALTPRHREDRYAAIFTLLLGSRAPAVLAAIPGAGPLDYSDIPQKFPLYRLFFPGKRFTLGKSRDFIRETAGLITNFAALVEDNPEDYLPAIRRENLSKDIYLESGGAWNFLYSRDILEP